MHAKKIFTLAILLVCWAPCCYASPSTCNVGQPTACTGSSDLYYIEAVLTANSSTGAFTDATNAITGIGGLLLGVQTVPGATAPTDDYDITITNAQGLDVMGGALANRDAVSTEFSLPAVNGTYGYVPITGPLSINISGNSAGSAFVTLRIFYFSR